MLLELSFTNARQMSSAHGLHAQELSQKVCVTGSIIVVMCTVCKRGHPLRITLLNTTPVAESHALLVGVLPGIVWLW